MKEKAQDSDPDKSECKHGSADQTLRHDMGDKMQKLEEESRKAQDFICGWGAAFVNITITFPINKVIFRQQLQGLGTHRAVRHVLDDGLTHMYRGLLPPLLQKTTSMALMFGCYQQFLTRLNTEYPDQSVLLHQTAAAMASGAIESVLAPFERVQTLMQDRKHHFNYKNTPHAFRNLWSHGIREYYRGWTAIVTRNSVSNALFFNLRGPCKSLLPESESAMGEVACDFASGAVLGAFISTVFFPVNVCKTAMQARIDVPHLSLPHACAEVYRERGRSVKRMFRGVHLNYTRSLLSWGIINSTFELLKKYAFGLS